jgi:radical SAM superfamily enzyme YgiQ (UPF0313 family)
VFGSFYRVRSPRNVCQEITMIKEKLGINDITFVDDLFGAKKGWIDEFLLELANNKINIYWKIQTRVDYCFPIKTL